MIWQTSKLSVFIAGVAEFADNAVTRFVILLFVNVLVLDIVGTITLATAIVPAELRVILVSEFHKSI